MERIATFEEEDEQILSIIPNGDIFRSVWNFRYNFHSKTFQTMLLGKDGENIFVNSNDFSSRIFMEVFTIAWNIVSIFYIFLIVYDFAQARS